MQGKNFIHIKILIGIREGEECEFMAEIEFM
jgi:hypothetical protein